MNNSYIEVQAADSSHLIPGFSEIKNPPKSAGEGLWIVLMLGIPILLWGLKEYISINLDALKAENSQELAEREKLISTLQEQLKYMQEKEDTLINEIRILRQPMDYSGDFTPRKEKNVR